MANDNQKNYPGEENYYNQDPQTGWSTTQNFFSCLQVEKLPNQDPQTVWPTTQNFDSGLQGGKLPDQPPKRRKFMPIVVSVLLVLVIILGATTVFALRRTNPTATAVGPKATTQPTASPSNVTPVPTSTSSIGGIATSTSTSSPIATAQPVATVASGTITENLLLTCGANCNDPVRVTITNVQVNDANGNMLWNISMKNITGSSVNYQIETFELLASGAQNQIPANFSSLNGNLPNSDPDTIQGIFAFVPVQNTTYTLTVGIYSGTQISFDPVQITNL